LLTIAPLVDCRPRHYHSWGGGCCVAQAEREELLFILADSGSTALVVEDRKTLKKLRDRLDSPDSFGGLALG